MREGPSTSHAAQALPFQEGDEAASRKIVQKRAALLLGGLASQTERLTFAPVSWATDSLAPAAAAPQRRA